MLTLHQYEISPFADKIRRILNWKGIPYQVVNHPLMARGAVKKLNAVGKVPVLEHDGLLVGDSTDIAYYLEQHFPENPLIPTDLQLKSQLHVLEDWADESLYFMEMSFRFGIKVNAKQNVPRLLAEDNVLVRALLAPMLGMAMGSIIRNQGIGRKTPQQWQADLSRHTQALAGYLQRDSWLLGEQLTLADIAVFVQLSCINETDEGRRIIAQEASVADWLQRVDQETATAKNLPSGST